MSGLDSLRRSIGDHWTERVGSEREESNLRRLRLSRLSASYFSLRSLQTAKDSHSNILSCFIRSLLSLSSPSNDPLDASLSRLPSPVDLGSPSSRPFPSYASLYGKSLKLRKEWNLCRTSPAAARLQSGMKEETACLQFEGMRGLAGRRGLSLLGD